MSKLPLEDKEKGIHRAKIWEIGFYACNNLSTNLYMLLMGSISYYLIGIPVSWLLGFKAGLGITGIWIGFPAGLTCAGIFFWRRFRHSLAEYEKNGNVQ